MRQYATIYRGNECLFNLYHTRDAPANEVKLRIKFRSQARGYNLKPLTQPRPS